MSKSEIARERAALVHKTRLACTVSRLRLARSCRSAPCLIATLVLRKIDGAQRQERSS